MSRKLKQSLYVIILILLSGAAVAAQPEFDQHKLTAGQIAGLHDASQAVLTARRQAREDEQADPVRSALITFREALIQIRDELMAVQTPAAATVDPDQRQINIASTPANSAQDINKKRLIANLNTRFETLTQRAEDRAAQLQASKQHGRARIAERRAARIAAMQAEIQGLAGKTTTEQRRIVNALLAKMQLKRLRDQQQTTEDNYPGFIVETSTSAPVTPPPAAKVRHRH